MEPVVRKLTMQTYKEQIALRERMSEALARRFEGENLTLEQKAKVAFEWTRFSMKRTPSDSC